MKRFLCFCYTHLSHFLPVRFALAIYLFAKSRLLSYIPNFLMRVSTTPTQHFIRHAPLVRLGHHDWYVWLNYDRIGPHSLSHGHNDPLPSLRTECRQCGSQFELLSTQLHRCHSCDINVKCPSQRHNRVIFSEWASN